MGCGASSGKKEPSKEQVARWEKEGPNEKEREQNRQHRLKSRQVFPTHEVGGEQGLPKDPLVHAQRKGKFPDEMRVAMDAFQFDGESSPRHNPDRLPPGKKLPAAFVADTNPDQNPGPQPGAEPPAANGTAAAASSSGQPAAAAAPAAAAPAEPPKPPEPTAAGPAAEAGAAPGAVLT